MFDYEGFRKIIQQWVDECKASVSYIISHKYTMVIFYTKKPDVLYGKNGELVKKYREKKF